jgi:DeoR/GlpR family transcriptional regulator of sugar metabolism
VLVEERRHKVLEIVGQSGFASLADLARRIQVSESTIRRDLEHLHLHGHLRRTHGGAVLAGEGAAFPALDERASHQREEKAAIGRLAASLIRDGDTVLLDGGTTTLEVARHLVGRPVQIVTNSLPIAQLFATSHSNELVVLGGFVYPRTGVAMGPLTIRMIEDLHVRVTVLSVGGITEQGLFNSNLLLVETERAMMRSADEVVVVADRTKLGRPALAWLCALGDVDDLVMDESPGLARPEWLERSGARLHVASHEGKIAGGAA